MENGITRRSAIKRMGAAVAGAAVLGTMPSFAREAMGLESVPQDSKPSDDPNASTLKMDYKLVYEGPDVVFHQINDHLWVGNGHRTYNESVYIVEGQEKALLVDTGTRMDHLDEMTTENNPWMQGYGYQIWRNTPGGFRADGARGQYIMVFPEKNAVIAVTADESRLEDEIEGIWNHLYDVL